MNTSTLVTSITVSLYYLTYGRHKLSLNIEVIWVLFFLLTMMYIHRYRSDKKTLLLLAVLMSVPITRAPLSMVSLLLCDQIKGLDFSAKYAGSIYRSVLDIKIVGTVPKKPTIMLLNYPAGFFEYQLIHLLSDKIALVCNTKMSKYYAPVVKGVPKILADVTTSGNFDRLKDEIKTMVDKGYNVVVYPEKNWKKRETIYHTVDKMKSGVFEIAKQTGITITPIVMDHFNAKAGVLLGTDFNIVIEKTRYVTDVSLEMKNMKKIFERNLERFSIGR